MQLNYLSDWRFVRKHLSKYHVTLFSFSIKRFFASFPSILIIYNLCMVFKYNIIFQDTKNMLFSVDDCDILFYPILNTI